MLGNKSRNYRLHENLQSDVICNAGRTLHPKAYRQSHESQREFNRVAGSLHEWCPIA